MHVIQCVRSLANTCGLGIYAIMLPSRGFSVAHSERVRSRPYDCVVAPPILSCIKQLHLSDKEVTYALLI